MSKLALELIKRCLETQDTYLDLGNCGLTDDDFKENGPFEKFIKKCTHLRTLVLSNRWFDQQQKKWIEGKNRYAENVITVFPTAFFSLNKVETLICRGGYHRMRIHDMSFVSEFAHLIYLDLSNNDIEAIYGLENLSSLKHLDLSENKIQKVTGLENLIRLKKLDISFNQIQILSGLENLQELVQLDISNNKINNIRPAIHFLYRKESPLNFVFKEDLWKLNDNEINVRTNPLTIPPIEIVQQGSKAIINYFEALEKQGVEYLYEAKMLIVGQPRAGKTSLRYKLFDHTSVLPGEEKTTRGIDIQRLNFEILDKEKKSRSFYYYVWDFGGQHIYQTTHQFFLTHRSLYVLVIDTGIDNVGNDDNNINYWLQTLELLGGNSPLLLVRNEKNERQIHIDVAQKKMRFNFLKRDYSLDLNALIPDTDNFNPKRLNDFKVLKEDIEIELRRLPLVGFAMPKNWVQIRNELQNLSNTKYYISRHEFIAICEHYDVLEFERQMELSQIFHDLGIFLHFQHYGALEDFIILQNTWATDAVFAVLDNTKVQANKGRFSDGDLAEFWASKVYQPSIHKKLLALMMQFELCYQVDPKQRMYIIPEMLSDKPPKVHKRPPGKILPLQYRYDFMPKGILTRLIVRLHKNIAVQKGQQLVWKTGVFINGASLDCFGTMAEITESWDSKQLSIRIQGSFAKDLMSKITFQIDELNSQFFSNVYDFDHSQKSKSYKMIPCNCPSCKNNVDKHFYDYHELLERKEFGKETIECKRKPFLNVNIADLLDGVFAKENNSVPIKAINETAKKIFISYSKDDLRLVNIFIKHLTALKRDGLVAQWYCTELIAGTAWDKTIQDYFDRSDVVCFMVSPNFMSTKYIYEHEIKNAFERKVKDKKFQIVPIILKRCSWTTKDFNLGDFTALPYTAKPVNTFKDQDSAWYIIVECLRLMIEKDLDPTGDDFYNHQPLPKDVLKIYESIVDGRADL